MRWPRSATVGHVPSTWTPHLTRGVSLHSDAFPLAPSSWSGVHGDLDRDVDRAVCICCSPGEPRTVCPRASHPHRSNLRTVLPFRQNGLETVTRCRGKRPVERSGVRDRQRFPALVHGGCKSAREDKMSRTPWALAGTRCRPCGGPQTRVEGWCAGHLPTHGRLCYNAVDHTTGRRW